MRSEHSWAAAVAYMFEGVPWVARHIGMPFGSSASVEAWHLVGELLCYIARRILFLPIYRYVDDYFAAERHVASVSAYLCVSARVDRASLMQHSLSVFVRLVRALLGHSAIADAKTGFGLDLVILGILVAVAA